MKNWRDWLAHKIFPLGIPLAWRQLVSERKRFLAAVAGIVVAVVMMLFQVGLYDALFLTVVRPIEVMNADLVMVSRNYDFIANSGQFPQRQLTQALADPAVVSVASVLNGRALWRHPETGEKREIFVLGCEPGEQAFSLRGLAENSGALSREDEVLYDLRSRAEFGPIQQWVEQGKAASTEVSDRRVRVAGLVDLGVTFAADGNLVAGTMAFRRIMPSYPAGYISVGLIRLQPGTSAELVLQQLRKKLPTDVQVMTKAELAGLERRYWAIRTPIGFVITASMLVSVLVGAVIIYQILYTDVSDHLAEYATLKALGFGDRFFANLVLQQSMMLSLLGFVPGTFLAAILYRVTERMAHLPMDMSLGRLAISYVLTLMMCVAAGWFAAGKLREADPAEVFA